MKQSIVLSTQMTQFQAVTFSGSLEANLSQIAGLGYQGVELAIRDPRLVNLDALDQMIRKYNLVVPAIGTGQAWGEEGLSFTDPDEAIRRAAIERIQSHIPIAAHFGAFIIIGLVRGIVKPGIEPSHALSWLKEALQECSQAAKAGRVRLIIEPLNRYETNLINNTAQALDLIQAVGADNFGLLLDTFHMNIEEANIEESIQICGKRIFHFHVADSNRWHPGAGHLNFKSILTALFESSYSGYISGEFMPKPDAATAAKESIQYLTRLGF